MIVLRLGGLGLQGPFSLVATDGATNLSADFEAAMEADTERPSFGGIDTLSALWVGPSPCGGDYFNLAVHVTAATDDWGVSRYEVFEETPSGPVGRGFEFDDGDPSPVIRVYGGSETQTRCFTAIALDIAGNGSEPTPAKCIDLVRPSSPDAGVIDAGRAVSDAGEPNADASVSTMDSSDGSELETEAPSCGCNSASTSKLGLAPLLISMGGLLSRRKNLRRL